MGLDSFKTEDTNGTSSDGELERIQTVDKAVEAVKEANDYIGHSPSQSEFNEIKSEIGYSTPASNFTRKSDVGVTFNKIKKMAGLSVNSESLQIEKAMLDNSGFGYIAGVILGDGTLHRGDGNYNTLTLQSKDKEFVCEFGQVLSDWGDLIWDGFDSEDTEVGCYGPIERDGRNVSDVWAVTKCVSGNVDILFNYQDNNFSLDSIDSRCTEFKINMVRGLWDSEGSIDVSTGSIRFCNTDDKVNLLYMKLLSDILEIELDLDGEWTDESTKSSKKKGEFRVTVEGDDIKKRDIVIPNGYREQFFRVIDPTIQRKRKVFKNYIN
jgi:hypothetical protein